MFRKLGNARKDVSMAMVMKDGVLHAVSTGRNWSLPPNKSRGHGRVHKDVPMEMDGHHGVPAARKDGR